MEKGGEGKGDLLQSLREDRHPWMDGWMDGWMVTGNWSVVAS